MLQELTGFDVCRITKLKGRQTPIIILSAKGEELDKLSGLELVEDDYIEKPFGLRELLSRIQTVKASGSNLGVNSKETSIGKMTINFSRYSARVDQQQIKMSHKEFEILKYLWDHRNTTVSRYQLLEDIWGYIEQPTTRTVDNFILKLRQKIEENPDQPRIILTVHGIGYKMLEPECSVLL